MFKSRIKKMLNLDRIPSMTPWAELDGEWAFYDESGLGTGSEERFSIVHVLMMYLGIELLNTGLKQSEAIFFLKHMRPLLEEQFELIHEKENATPPISQSQNVISETVWMAVRRQEIKETHPGFRKKVGDKTSRPLFIQPEFFNGFDAVSEKFRRQLNSYRNVILIEIADPALALPALLEQIPVVQRGRKSRSDAAK